MLYPHNSLTSRLALKLFRGEPAISEFDWNFSAIHSSSGAFVGGILIGIIEAMAQAYISTSLANSIVFGVLIIVLLVKPAGLLGKYVPEKV